MPHTSKIVLKSLLITGMLALPTGVSTRTTNDEMSKLTAFFAGAQIVDAPKVVDCTLSGGTQTQCFSITVISEPSSYTPGPWCPTNAADGPDKAGIWLEGGKAYDADGTFVQSMPQFYNDENWQLFDPETGKINVTNSLEACLGAASPATAHGAQIGIAMDGYSIFASGLADGTPAKRLDRCNGHKVETLGDHYHAGTPGSNAILGCLSAEYGCHSNGPTAVCDATARPPLS